LSSFLKRMRVGVSLFALFAFLHSELIWGMGAERLIPGEPLQTTNQQTTQPSNPAKPGEIQKPQSPIDSQSTTVIEVTVPKGVHFGMKVEEGEGVKNTVGVRSLSRPLVTVRDERGQVLEGALVTFIAPVDGPSVVFSNGLRTLTIMTDAFGQARVASMRAVNAGSFKLEVSASYRGQIVSTVINQTNYDRDGDIAGVKPARSRKPAATSKSGLSGGALGLLIGGAAAAVLGIALGLGGHKGSGSTGTGATATIGGTGTPTVGAPPS
jgi:hypothetical protein